MKLLDSFRYAWIVLAAGFLIGIFLPTKIGCYDVCVESNSYLWLEYNMTDPIECDALCSEDPTLSEMMWNGVGYSFWFFVLFAVLMAVHDSYADWREKPKNS